MSEKNVVNSSAWLAYLADGPNADFFSPPIESGDLLVVPVVSVYEVYKRVYQQRNENDALRPVALMQRGELVELDNALDLEAAKLSIAHKLPLADSMILATAGRVQATLWTQDGDFEELAGVNYQPARRRRD